MVLKGSKADLWVRNVQLSLFSLVPALLPAITGSGGGGRLFDNFGFWAWSVVGTQVFGGLVTALVIKYSDNILKGFATSLSIILSFLAGVVLFRFQITTSFVFGTVVVLGATLGYNRSEKSAKGEGVIGGGGPKERTSPVAEYEYTPGRPVGAQSSIRVNLTDSGLAPRSPITGNFNFPLSGNGAPPPPHIRGKIKVTTSPSHSSFPSTSTITATAMNSPNINSASLRLRTDSNSSTGAGGSSSGILMNSPDREDGFDEISLVLSHPLPVPHPHLTVQQAPFLNASSVVSSASSSPVVRPRSVGEESGRRVSLGNGSLIPQGESVGGRSVSPFDSPYSPVVGVGNGVKGDYFVKRTETLP